MFPKVFREGGPFAVPGRMSGNSTDSDINDRVKSATWWNGGQGGPTA